MLLRFGFLYSCFMIVAGSSLLAELPGEPIPAVVELPVPMEVRTPAPAEPAALEPEPTPAYSLQKPIPALLKTAQAESSSSSWDELKAFREKRQRLRTLEKEVNELRKTLGIASQYHLECILEEVSMKILRQLDPEIHSNQESLSVVSLLNDSTHPAMLPTPQFRALQKCLESTGTLKTLARPSLILTENAPATYVSGGEIPLPMGQDSIQRVSYRAIGTFLQAEIRITEPRKLQLQFRVEQTSRDDRHVVKAGGFDVPGLTSQALGSTVNLSPSQTVLVSGISRNSAGEEVCLLAALTVSPIPQPETALKSPQQVLVK